MDTKLRRKPRVDVSLTRRQQQERERLIRMKRDSRPMPMMINGSSTRMTPASPASPARRAPMLQRSQRPTKKEKRNHDQ